MIPFTDFPGSLNPGSIMMLATPLACYLLDNAVPEN